MRHTTLNCASLFGALLCSTLPLASGARTSDEVPQYNVRDMGTWGGPDSYYLNPAYNRPVNNRGVVVGWADTPADDPTCYWDCFVVRAFVWHDGVRRTLPLLPGGVNNVAQFVLDNGMIVGNADNGVVDPLTGIVQQVTVVWDHGRTIALGTLGGFFSYPNGVNGQGHVVGFTNNSTPDDYSFYGGQEVRAFLWRGAGLEDLGTLGGPDSFATDINSRDQIAGMSYTDATPTPVIGLPTQHIFLWEHGQMRDLGTLGGTYAAVGSFLDFGGTPSINERGQIIGTSFLEGDEFYHAFLWSHDRMRDLGTLPGGNNSEASSINNAGTVVGWSDVDAAGVDHRAFLWRPGSGMIDLGAAPGWPCSRAVTIANNGDVLVDNGICGVGGGPGALWRNGQLYDLNERVPAGTSLFIDELFGVNSRGEIAARGVLEDGNVHAVVLVPCGGDGEAACDGPRTAHAVQARAAKQPPASLANLRRVRFVGR